MSVLEAHPHAAAVLGAALRDRPSHAYLFHGPAGSGKREAAREFAAELLSRDAPGPRERPRARARRRASRPHLGRAQRRPHHAARRRRPVRGGRRLAHAVRGGLARVRARARRHDGRPGRQHAAQDARGAARLRRADPAHRPPDAGAADDHLALPGRALRRAAAGAAGRAAGVARRRRPPAPAPARGSRSATASARSRSRSATGRRCAPAPRRSPARRCAATSARSSRGPRCWPRPAPPGDAAEAELEQALATELEYLPKKEHRRKQTEFTERARRAARRAETGALDHALQLVGLWYRDLACLAADAEELVLATDRLEELRADADAATPHALHAALELVEDTRARLPVQRQLRPRAAGARLPARAHARGRAVPA